ncbi:MBL fold metallo-hydrolase [Bosea sp. (in: a-proteobacteria)]|uniref:MBL fold metallo-hydrolase n=1 Tax=Bosea sp. (in: a-proteobacteria) TaxID=1871050 RepID=UPI0026025E25|nr:MBL fold metallo-hydrolase [Bosea sp. (in: a-proteobacteria)]MCO5090138.1 MBL fold metallo-hydrolase [Bosea sp. (in: a-proteobacteria)]
MKLTIHGGIGEKGRTCVGAAQGATRLLLDVGIDTGVARGPGYYPALTRAELSLIDAIIVTHAHEDHVAALGWCLANGFAGRILMTAQTAAETDAVLAAYATPEERALARQAAVEIIAAGADFSIGPIAIRTGRTGHVVGGIWCHLSAGGRRLGYCGDVVPESPVFAMDPLPPCDLILLDASYGADRIPTAERGAAIRRWLAAHPEGAVLPTPLSGRSIELLGLIETPIAIHPAMREALERQVAATAWLKPGLAATLSARLAGALIWEERQALPPAALIVDDGMGMAGPSRPALAQAQASRHPVLLTGGIPKGSPADCMLAAGEAQWLRFPTHPTLPENVAIAAASGAGHVLAHSCDAATALTLAADIPGLVTGLAPGDTIEV